MALDYKAPIDDYVFLLDEFLPQMGEPSPVIGGDDVRELLGHAERFFVDTWLPLYQTGDEQGCKLENGVVRAPDGFAEAYRQYCEAGWNCVAVPEDQGGAGLPATVALAVREMASGTNTSLSLYSGLTMAAHATLARTGEDWMRENIVPKMVSGIWTGTMCLTEPHCGTDLRLMKTKAVPQADGSYRITGTKIFISGGDHDLAENIVHLVLAKLPNEDGKYVDDLSTVSLFLVTRSLVDPDSGEMGPRNTVSAGGVEKKMGLKGNATCTMNFDDAVAFRLGTTSKSGSAAGMSGMFDMMNKARLGTGMQALASAQLSHVNAANYAQERRAGRAALAKDRSGEAADPILVHPDVRRVLMKQRAFIEAARALGIWVTSLLEPSEQDQESSQSDKRLALASFLTPVIKAYFSDRAFEATNDSIQIMGGHGYIKDHGLEQVARDARIFQLYEGANGVQAFDLAARKLTIPGALAAFTEELDRTIMSAEKVEHLKSYASQLASAKALLSSAASWLSNRDERHAYDLGAGSYDFLSLIGGLAGAMVWLRMGLAASAQSDPDARSPLQRRKLSLMRFWFEREMPALSALEQQIRAGAENLDDVHLLLN